MYAVIQTGGKQERVQPGDILQIEKIEGNVGASVTFDQVLFLSKPDATTPQVLIGKPTVAGAKVEAEIVGQGRGEKILIIKMKRRKQYRRTQGHRQYYTQILVTKVEGSSLGSASLDEAAKKQKLTSFQSHLAPKGLAFTPKTIGSRERLRRLANPEAAGSQTTGEQSSSSPAKKAASSSKTKSARSASSKAKKAPAAKKKPTSKSKK